MGSGLKESSPQPPVAPGPPPPGQGSHVSVGLTKLVSLGNLGGPCSDTFLQPQFSYPENQAAFGSPSNSNILGFMCREL